MSRLGSMDGVSVKKILDDGQHRLGFVFQQVVAGVFKQVGLGPGETPTPFPVVIQIEHEVVFSPADEHGDMVEAVGARGRSGKRCRS